MSRRDDERFSKCLQQSSMFSSDGNYVSTMVPKIPKGVKKNPRRLAILTTAMSIGSGKTMMKVITEMMNVETCVCDLNTINPLTAADVFLATSVMSGLNHITTLQYNRSDIIDFLTGRSILKLVQSTPHITIINFHSTLFEEGNVKTLIYNAALANDRQIIHNNNSKSMINKCIASRHKNFQKRRTAAQEIVLFTAIKKMFLTERRARLFLSERSVRKLIHLEIITSYNSLLITHTKCIQNAAESSKLRELNCIPRYILNNDEGYHRTKILKNQNQDWSDLLQRILVDKFSSVKSEKSRLRAMRKQRLSVSQLHLSKRKSLCQDECRDFNNMMEGYYNTYNTLFDQRASQLAAIREKALLQEQEAVRIREEKQLLERNIKNRQRQNKQERESVLREERIIRSEVSLRESRENEIIRHEWFRDYSKSKVLERKGIRKREKISASLQTPILRIAYTEHDQSLHCSEVNVKYFCSGQSLLKQVLSRGRLQLEQKYLSYHSCDEPESDDDEPPQEWITRKTRVYGGTIKFILLNPTHLDSIDIVDKTVHPDVSTEVDSVVYQARPIAKIIEKFPKESDQGFTEIEFKILPKVTVDDINMILRLVGVRRQSHGGLPSPTSQTTTDNCKSRISVSVSVKIQFSTVRGEPSDEDLKFSSSAASIFINYVPSHFSLVPGGATISYKEGDGDCLFLKDIRVSQPSDLFSSTRDFCGFYGDFSTPESPKQLFNWEGYTLLIKHTGVQCPRDSMCFRRQPTRFGSSSIEDELHLSDTKSIIINGNPLAHITAGILVASESKRHVPTLKSPLYQFQFTGYMMGQRVTKLLHHLAFRNDSNDPHDGTRIIEISLEDHHGESDTIRLGIEVTSEDNKTTISLSNEVATFRRVAGDIHESLQPEYPTQQYSKLSPDAIVSDVDTDHFNTGNLTISYLKGGTLQDSFSLSSDEVQVEGSNLMFKGVLVAIVDQSKKSKMQVSLSFVRNASINAVQGIIRSLSFCTEPLASLSSEFGRARQVTQKQTENIVHGTVKNGIREVEISLVVDQAEPVIVKMFIKVLNSLISIPTNLQCISFIEGSDPIRLSARYDLLNDVNNYDSGSIIVDIITGCEPKDGLEMKFPEGGEFVLGRKDTVENYRDLYIATTGTGSKTLIGYIQLLPTTISVTLKQDAKEQTSKRQIKRRDIGNLLRLFYYQHKGDNPKLLRKVVKISLDDGQGIPSCALIQVTVQAVNDVTQIIRKDTKPGQYRQSSREDLNGYCPFDDCVLYDADTENFKLGYIAVEILGGMEKGVDELSLLPCSLQIKKGYTSIFKIDNINTVFQDDIHIGKYRASRDLFAIDFETANDIPIQTVEHIMKLIRYRNIAKRAKPSTVTLTLKILADEGPEGKLKLPIQVSGPLISVGSASPIERVWREEPLTVFPSTTLSLPDRHKCLGVYVTVRVTDDTLVSGDQLGFNFTESPFHFTIKSRKQLFDGSVELGRIEERTAGYMKVTFVSNGKCTAKHVQGFLRCISYTYDGDNTSASRFDREIEIVIFLTDALPGMIVQKVRVSEPGSPPKIILSNSEIVTNHGVGLLPLFCDCVIEDSSTKLYEKGTYVLVEVQGVKNVSEDSLSLYLPMEDSSFHGVISDLRVDSEGWVVRADDKKRLARIEGRQTASFKVIFISATVDIVQELVKSIAYTVRNTKRLVATGVEKLVQITIKSSYQRPTKSKIKIEVLPAIMEPIQGGGSVIRIDPRKQLEYLFPNFHLFINIQNSISLSVGFVRSVVLPDSLVRVPGWSICFDSTFGRVSQDGATLLTHSDDSSSPLAVINQDVLSLDVEFLPTVTASIIESFMRSITIKNTDHAARNKNSSFLIRIQLTDMLEDSTQSYSSLIALSTK